MEKCELCERLVTQEVARSEGWGRVQFATMSDAATNKTSVGILPDVRVHTVRTCSRQECILRALLWVSGRRVPRLEFVFATICIGLLLLVQAHAAIVNASQFTPSGMLWIVVRGIFGSCVLSGAIARGFERAYWEKKALEIAARWRS
jgi:hypothetical protein